MIVDVNRKDTQSIGMLFRTDDGETYAPLGRVTETLIIDDLVPEDQTHLPFVKLDDAITFSCKFKMDNPTIIFLMTGKWPSNNWLKMHGYPMRRAHGNRRRQSPKRRQARHKAQSVNRDGA